MLIDFNNKGISNMSEHEFPRAIHLPGGNVFDDMRVDIDESHKVIASNIFKVHDRLPSRLASACLYALNAVTQRLRINEFLMLSGIRRQWFDEFMSYWTRVLSGRPLTFCDFFMLLHDYRKRQQHMEELDWNSPEKHVSNWQDYGAIYSIFALTRSAGIRPIVGRGLWRHIKPGARIVEYGCSLAPFYHTYRNFYAYRKCSWMLADLANFPFHYAKYLYRNDPKLKFHTIEPSSFDAPLPADVIFDVVIVVNVFEHLDDPLRAAKYLLSKMSSDALLVFDFLESDGKGFDTPKGLEQREACLAFLTERLEVIHGSIDAARDVGFTIARLR
jgi:SAM-dependent methyltransferase